VTQQLKVQCCIAGGGPAGMMLGWLLARAGVSVAVLEKHADFLRDFRGDTIHPSTLEVIGELGLLEEFLARPHQQVSGVTAEIGGREIRAADFSHLPTTCGFIAFMPQWDFLDFINEQASSHAHFHLRRQAEVRALLEDDQRVTGVLAHTPDGELSVLADLVIGADGRDSVVRARAGLKVRDLGAPMDVLWMKLPWRDGDPVEPKAWFSRGGILVSLYRGDYWQCGYVIPKGGYQALREKGMAHLQREIAEAAPAMADRLDSLTDFRQINLLTVKVDRLQRWYRDGLLCLGDAAHAMSPVGGVGINLAIQDAVAAANLLARPLRGGFLARGHLHQVQQRRLWPTRVTQRAQVVIQRRIIDRVLKTEQPLRPPAPLRLMQRWPVLRRIPGRLIGMGVRPEHVDPAIFRDSP
jgi:2-polyprenyl-6-methoxyphenol hydroxylase-like FAD-dependent oxidoreductase